MSERRDDGIPSLSLRVYFRVVRPACLRLQRMADGSAVPAARIGEDIAHGDCSAVMRVDHEIRPQDAAFPRGAI